MHALDAITAPGRYPLDVYMDVTCLAVLIVSWVGLLFLAFGHVLNRLWR